LERDHHALGKFPTQPKRFTTNKKLFDSMPHFRRSNVRNIGAGSVIAEKVFDRDAETNLTVCNADHFDKAAVEKHDPKFGVEHAKTLRHLSDGNGVDCEKRAKLAGRMAARRPL